jgi:abortive infection bacteriophage resistance protein
VEFTKEHRSYQAQVQLLAGRGLQIGDHAAAISALKRIGYYRLSAYTYPLRHALSGDQAPGDSRRSDQFIEGATLDTAVQLHDFDHKLRGIMLTALQALEIGLRTKVAYHLSKRGAMAHLDSSALDETECGRQSSGPDSDATKYETWRNEYDKLQAKASEEQYVKHFMLNYNCDVPIWAAGEFMTMGCLIGLYRLMTATDAGRIAEELGVKNKDVLFGWLKALNVTRNHCAHNARIWNRSTTYPPNKINLHIVGDELKHLQSADRDRIYFLAAVLAYLLRRVDPSTRFPSDFRTLMTKFPDSPTLKPEDTMGLVDGWRGERLWQPTLSRDLGFRVTPKA